jgi:outer membrane protein
MKMKYTQYKILAAVLLITFAMPVVAQNNITLEQCIQQALERNFSLKMARNDMKIAENNVSASPFLPSITATGKQLQDNYISSETSSDDESIRRNTYAAGVSMSWTIFDGLSMFAEYSKQRQLFALSNQRVKVEVESLVMEVCSEFYNIIVQQRLLESELTSLSLSKSRYANAEEKYMLGVISGLDLQQARLDLNADSSKVLSQNETVNSAYIRLANLLTAGAETKYNIHDTIILSQEMNFDTLKARTITNNNTLIMARQGETISEKDLDIIRSARYPTLSFTSGYNFTKYDYPWTNYFSQSKGMYYGLNISWNIFNGLETKRKITNARIESENSRLAYQDAENQILGDLSLLYNNYRNNIIVTSFEKENVEVAEKSLDIALARYKLGSLSGLEFREYQNKYLEAINRRLTALYQAKISEIGLRLLCGELTEK